LILPLSLLFEDLLMSLTISKISSYVPEKGKIALWWLGGAGFLLALDTGERICIDPYLSDFVERVVGFRRLIPPPIKAEDLRFSLLLLTHSHPDHLDGDSFDTLMRSNPDCRIIAPANCFQFLQDHDASPEITAPGKVHRFGSVTIEAVPADHVPLSPEAVGYIISLSGRSAWFTGDTALNWPLLESSIRRKPDILVPCINSAYGNLGENGAALLAEKCGARIVIPAHYGMFNEHGGDVDLFRMQMMELAPNAALFIPVPGEGAEI
jgi:L-ascorbate 6-phosphate lactonase